MKALLISLFISFGPSTGVTSTTTVLSSVDDCTGAIKQMVKTFYPDDSPPIIEDGVVFIYKAEGFTSRHRSSELRVSCKPIT